MKKSYTEEEVRKLLAFLLYKDTQEQMYSLDELLNNYDVAELFGKLSLLKNTDDEDASALHKELSDIFIG